MKRILWWSRHEPLPAQLAELRKAFGEDMVCDRAGQTFTSVEEIKQRFVDGQYDEIVIVAPLSVIKKLTEIGVYPIWAEMKVIPCPDKPDPSRETETKGRWYRFERFRKIVSIQIEFREL